MSCPQIIARYPRRDMVGDVDVDIMAKDLYPAQETKKDMKRHSQCTKMPLIKHSVFFIFQNSDTPFLIKSRTHL